MNTKYRILLYLLSALVIGTWVFNMGAMGQDSANTQLTPEVIQPSTAEIALGHEPPFPPSPPMQERLRDQEREREGYGNQSWFGEKAWKHLKKWYRWEKIRRFMDMAGQRWGWSDQPDFRGSWDDPRGSRMRRGMERRESGPGLGLGRRSVPREEMGPGREPIQGGRMLGALIEQHPDWAKQAREKIADGVPPREVAQEFLERLSKSDDPKDRELADQIKKFHEERFGGRSPGFGRPERSEGKVPAPPFGGRERFMGERFDGRGPSFGRPERSESKEPTPPFGGRERFMGERFGGRGPAFGRPERSEGKEPAPPTEERERIQVLREKYRNADTPEQREKIQTELRSELEKRFQNETNQLKEQMERLEKRMKELQEKREAVISDQEKKILSKE